MNKSRRKKLKLKTSRTKFLV